MKDLNEICCVLLGHFNCFLLLGFFVSQNKGFCFQSELDLLHFN